MQAYSLTDVPLIPQDKNMACWYASAQMLINWRRNKTLSCEMSFPDPKDIRKLQKIYLENDGLSTSMIMDLAQNLGLKAVPPVCPSPGAIASMLKDYGPLWFAGLHPSGHVVVITGISENSVFLNDPWPVNQGARREMSFNRLDQINQPLVYGENLLESVLIRFGLTPGKLAANLLHFPG